MNNYNFQKFTKIGAKLSNYSISINGKSYSFGFNAAFYMKQNIKNYKKVILFYDNKNKAIAFKFTNEDEKSAFTIIHGSRGNTGSVTAKSFYIDNELLNQEYFGQKKPKKIQDDNLGLIYVVDLVDNKKQED